MKRFLLTASTFLRTVDAHCFLTIIPITAATNLRETLMQDPTNSDLEENRKPITEYTLQIAVIACKRLLHMESIARSKKASGNTQLPIFLEQRELELREECRNIAIEMECDPDKIERLISELMSDGKYTQLEILKRDTVFTAEPISPATLTENLMELTSAIASTYEMYDRHDQGTHVECLHERDAIEELAQSLESCDVALNLGCATGTYVTEILNTHSRHVIGYDISEEMINYARKNYPDNEFHIYDLNEGIPYKNNSAALIIANLGAASELQCGLLSEISRVLRPGGHAYLSYYNRDALSIDWWAPLLRSFRSMVNPLNDTILVPFVKSDGSAKNVWIHGKSCTTDSIRAETARNNLEVERIESSSPLWDDKQPEFFRNKKAVAKAMAYDNACKSILPALGQYLRVLIRKP